MPHRLVLVGYALRDTSGQTLQRLPDGFARRLQAIDPGCEVVYAPVPYDAALQVRMRSLPRAELLRELDKFSPEYVAALERAVRGATVREAAPRPTRRPVNH